MMKFLTKLMIIILALTLGVPIGGCQDKEKEKDRGKEKVVDVHVGQTEVKVERTKKPDEKGGQVDVEVEHHPTPESGNQTK